jgi:hypothetical protein
MHVTVDDGQGRTWRLERDHGFARPSGHESATIASDARGHVHQHAIGRNDVLCNLRRDLTTIPEHRELETAL